MGKKGDKMTPDAVKSVEHLLGRLESIGVTSKKMFGGFGIFHEGKMFGIVDSRGAWFFKADESTLADYEKYGSSKHSRMPYYSIPDDIIQDLEKLKQWAQKSIKISK